FPGLKTSDLIELYYQMQPEIAAKNVLEIESYLRFNAQFDKLYLAHQLSNIVPADLEIICHVCEESFENFLYCGVCYYCWMDRVK
ncbi:MAG: hypothetical protein MHPSP_004792, partial [Paramarteilia canceri]